MHELEEIAEPFMEIAHRIVWATAATVDPTSAPRTRILHPIWEWDGARLVGWVATSPQSPKAKHLALDKRTSLTYWDATHDTATIDCQAFWEEDENGRNAGWKRFLEAPEPVGYDPSIVPAWTSPNADQFGILRLEPFRMRVLPGTAFLGLDGELLTWRCSPNGE